MIHDVAHQPTTLYHPTAMDLLQVQEVVVEFDGFRALDVRYFGVDRGELRVVIGPNGAGKTTLCDVISGKTRPVSGTVVFDDVDITGARDTDIARLGVGRKFQTPTVFDSLTVRENVALALPGRRGALRNLFGRASAAERGRIAAVLERVHLAAVADGVAGALSHGQRQWLEIGMLLMQDPELLLVDEPVAGMTDQETEQTAELLRRIAGHRSVIVVEHDMEFVRTLASKVTVLHEGTVLAEGPMDQVQANERVIEVYLGR